MWLRQAALAGVALALAAAAATLDEAFPYQISLAPADWSTYANGSADQRFALAGAEGALSFNFPSDAAPFFTSAGRSLTAPSADYMFTAAVPNLSRAHALTAVFTIAASPGAAFNARFEATNTCPGGPTVRLLLATRGPLTDWRGATLRYTRWYSAPIPLTLGPHTLTAPLTGAAWTDVFADPGNAAAPPPGQTQPPAAGFRAALASPKAGLVFGGGCFAGHGIGVTGGAARFTLTSFRVD